MDLTINERLYLNAKKYARECKEENRGDLYYILLDWCEQQGQRLQNSVYKKTDVYIIEYQRNDGEICTESFKYKDEFYNPYTDALNRFNELIIDGNPYASLTLTRLPYLSLEGMNTNILFSYGKKI